MDRISFSYSPLVGITADYEIESFKFIAGYQKGRIKDLLPRIAKISSYLSQIPDDVISNASFAADYMDLEGSYCDYISMGISYDNNAWTIQTEASQYQFEKASDLRYISAYVSIGYRIGDFLPFIIYSKFYNSIKSVTFVPNFEKIAVFPTKELFSAFVDLSALSEDLDAHQDTVSLGVRWNLAPNYALKLQCDHTWFKESKKNQTLLWASDPAMTTGFDKRVNIFSVSFDFFF